VDGAPCENRETVTLERSDRLLTAVRDHARFLGALARRPTRVGAVAPSSGRLAQAMTRGMGLEHARVVVELGPGTGAFTRVIERQVSPQALLLAVELDAALAAELRRRHPRARVVHDSAERLVEHLDTHGHPAADCIISGLPWASFPRDLQERLLEAVFAGLRPGGRFATFAYVHALRFPPARRFRRALEQIFPVVATSPVVWRNLPPAVVHRCQK
jgi:phospholipid N-methyltransferase